MRARTLLPLILAVMVTAAARGQTVLPTTSTRAWNTYVPCVIASRYSTIVGNGGTLFPGSGTIGQNSFAERVYSFRLPFGLLFMNEEFPEGSAIIVSTNGFISFRNADLGSTDGSSYWWWDLDGWAMVGNGAGMAAREYVIMPYAGNLATQVPSGDGGVYWRVDGTAPRRVLIFEWRAMNNDTWGSNGNVGNFQALLYEGTNNLEFHYGETSIDVGEVWFTHFVGLKKYGEVLWMPNIPDNDARIPIEQDRYLFFNNPAYGEGDTVAVTGMRIRNWMWGWADIESTPWFSTPFGAPDPVGSPYGFHYSFPTTEDGERVAYRLSSVLDDVAADSAWVTPSQPVSAYAPGSSVYLHAQFLNQGNRDRQDVQVRADVYRNGIRVFTTDEVIFRRTTPQFGSEVVDFTTPVAEPITNTTGQYEVRIYAQFREDQDPSNDTAKALFYISRDNDIMPYMVLQPQSNLPPLFPKYPVGVGVPIEIRFLNIGLRAQRDVPVGVAIYDEAGSQVFADSAVLLGTWPSITFRDWSFRHWTPSTTGRFYVRAFARLNGDEQPNNDVLPAPLGPGVSFDVRYETEIAAVDPAQTTNLPLRNGSYPIGKPVPVVASFSNSGVSDATNVPSRVKIVGPGGAVVYDRSALVLEIRCDNGRTAQGYPPFIPQQPGRYCVTAFAEYADEPIRLNDTAQWYFNVKPALSGTIRVGYGERYRTIREAHDSLFFYGVSGPVTFELTNDTYTESTRESTTPSLDWRGRVVGLGPGAPVVFRPHSAKSMVTINMKSASGFGMWFGQIDTSNPSGYVSFDGGPRKALTFTYENTNRTPSSPAWQRSVPFYFGQGASNYTIRNATIRPATEASGRKDYLTIPIVEYNQSFNEFRYTQDLNLALSAGILVRNSAPVDPVIGRNWNNRDTLRNQNNTFEGNTISGFGYGIVSVGAGPLFVVGTGRYEEFNNRSNRYLRNSIANVARGGIVLVFEDQAEIIGNAIHAVNNPGEALPHAWGVAAVAGGNADNNRGYSTSLKIEKNVLYDIGTAAGDASGIFLETAEDVFITPSNVVYRFPKAGATKLTVWNNTMHSVHSSDGSSYGVAVVPERSTRDDLVTSENRVENNTIYSTVPSPSSTSSVVGIRLTRAGSSVRNNIINLEGDGARAIDIMVSEPSRTMVCDYNAFDVPNGSIGSLQLLSREGYRIPSPGESRTLAQWQLSGFDRNSLSADLTREFVSSSPGSEDLHIQTTLLGTVVGNRGTPIAGMSDDIDGNPRGASPVAGRYDIGSDEFTGQVRNHDILAESIVKPIGYRASKGQYSDAEYVMSDSAVALGAVVRNIGGQPMTQRDATISIAYVNPRTGADVPVLSRTLRVDVDVAQTATTDFGSFQPSTLRELGLYDRYFGSSPNVSPVYRFTLRTGTDDNVANNTSSKEVRFYLQRSGREALVAVENLEGWNGGNDPIAIADRLNADTLLSALTHINWERSDGYSREDYDLFERDRWPSENLDFTAWSTIIWAQGSEENGLTPNERAALRRMLDRGTPSFRNTLVMAGQDVARIHDVALNERNGEIADRDFVSAYLRAQYRGATDPAAYDHRTIRGVAINAGRYEELASTGERGDEAPAPALLRTTAGEGIARASHVYAQQIGKPVDSAAGVASSASSRNVVYYGFDWRHVGRYDYEPDRSGAWRLLLAALDYSQSNRGVLPVELVSFAAYQCAERAVSVDWATAAETEIGSMEIERASVVRGEEGEQIGPFRLLERVASRGSATSGATYRVIDRNAEPGAEYVYRLATLDLDGSRFIEAQARVEMTGASASGPAIGVYPNPVTGRATIAYTSPEGVGVEIALHDALGRLTRVLATGTGSGTIPFNTDGLASGTYTLRLRSASGAVVTERITVQR